MRTFQDGSRMRTIRSWEEPQTRVPLWNAPRVMRVRRMVSVLPSRVCRCSLVFGGGDRRLSGRYWG